MKTALLQYRSFLVDRFRRPERSAGWAIFLEAAVFAYSAAAAGSAWNSYLGSPSGQMPLVLTGIPLAWLWMLSGSFQSRRRPWRIRSIDDFLAKGISPAKEQEVLRKDGRRVLRLRPKRSWGELAKLLGIASVLLLLLLILVMGLVASPLESERVARAGLMNALEVLGLMIPYLTLVYWLEKGEVSWDERTVVLAGRRLDRSAITRVALCGDGQLRVRVAGRRWALAVPQHSLWTASVLERLGYGIEFSEKPI